VQGALQDHSAKAHAPLLACVLAWPEAQVLIHTYIYVLTRGAGRPTAVPVTTLFAAGHPNRPII
jgi:hypothetical protein